MAWSPAGAVEVIVLHDAPALEAVRSHMPAARRIQVQGDGGRFACTREKLALPERLGEVDIIVSLDADTILSVMSFGRPPWPYSPAS